mmetsp:Transcript_90318/g.149643  ORF Transcript_90318/g.149643 Transcript_90318/m.149643 type:complete len:108 (+) Transcript_90318:134-457(+)
MRARAWVQISRITKQICPPDGAAPAVIEKATFLRMKALERWRMMGNAGCLPSTRNYRLPQQMGAVLQAKVPTQKVLLLLISSCLKSELGAQLAQEPRAPRRFQLVMC